MVVDDEVAVVDDDIDDNDDDDEGGRLSRRVERLVISIVNWIRQRIITPR